VSAVFAPPSVKIPSPASFSRTSTPFLFLRHRDRRRPPSKLYLSVCFTSPRRPSPESLKIFLFFAPSSILLLHTFLCTTFPPTSLDLPFNILLSPLRPLRYFFLVSSFRAKSPPRKVHIPPPACIVNFYFGFPDSSMHQPIVLLNRPPLVCTSFSSPPTTFPVD